jgi:5-dehydro-4-deoxyglucarate dehydratase
MVNLKDKLKGVFGFPVTPFKDDLTLDLDALDRVIEMMMPHPFCAIVIVGGTGEIYSLAPDEAVTVVERAVKTVNGRMPVVAGVGYNTPIGCDLARRMEKAGADALLVMPPYYTNAPEAGLFAYYKAIGEASGLPLALYSRDWAVFSPDQVARLADMVPTLQLWKDGQGNGRVLRRIMNKVGDRLAWIGGLGDDCASTYFAAGVQAYTSSISNLAPKVSLAIAEAGMKRDFDALDKLMDKYVHPLYALRERERGYEVTVIKEAMARVGLCGAAVRPPLCPMRTQDIEELERILETYRDMLSGFQAPDERRSASIAGSPASRIRAWAAGTS